MRNGGAAGRGEDGAERPGENNKNRIHMHQDRELSGSHTFDSLMK